MTEYLLKAIFIIVLLAFLLVAISADIKQSNKREAVKAFLRDNEHKDFTLNFAGIYSKTVGRIFSYSWARYEIEIEGIPCIFNMPSNFIKKEEGVEKTITTNGFDLLELMNRAGSLSEISFDIQ